MLNYRVPLPLARLTMTALPAPVLQRMIDILIGGMKRSHPRLFKNLRRLEAARVRVEPSDVRHSFVLQFGNGEALLEVAAFDEGDCDACIRGNLAALIALLEGREDGDKLFFSRDLEITGKTDVIVALRNTLDREEINVMEDVIALFGPFAGATRMAVEVAEALAERLRGHGENPTPNPSRKGRGKEEAALSRGVRKAMAS